MSFPKTLLLTALLAASCRQGEPASPRRPPGETPAPSTPAVRLALNETPPEGLTGAIAFHSDRHGRYKIFTLDLPTSQAEAVTTAAAHNDEDPAWSPDGRRLAFATTQFDNQTYDVAVLDVASGTVRRLTSHAAFEQHPAWTPDGSAVLFSSEQDGTQAVFRLTLTTGVVDRLTPPPDRALMPDASPDGRQVTFTRGTTDGLQIWVQDSDSSALQQLTRVPYGAVRARWSPDGKRIAYTRLVPSGSFLEVLELSTGSVQPIAIDGLARLTEPAWSPDGRWLAAAGTTVAGAVEDWDLILLRLAPSPSAYRLTRGRGSDRAPAWSPRRGAAAVSP